MAKKSNLELIRVNINLPSQLVEKVKKYGEENGLNTTSAYIVLLNQALSQAEAMTQLPNLLTMMGQIQQLTDCNFINNNQDLIQNIEGKEENL